MSMVASFSKLIFNKFVMHLQITNIYLTFPVFAISSFAKYTGTGYSVDTFLHKTSIVNSMPFTGLFTVMPL